MPELAEVALMVHDFTAWHGDAAVTEVHVHDPKVLEGDPKLLVGAAFLRVWRRGKYLIAEQAEAALVLHFRMTGKLVARDTPKARLSLHFSGGEVIHFEDTRRFGQAWVFPLSGGSDGLKAFLDSRPLGPEFYPMPRNPRWWSAQFARAKGPIKTALLDQRRVAGIGNILATEACFLASLDPTTPTPWLKDRDWSAIHRALHQLIDNTLVRDAEGEITYVTSNKTVTWTHVYGREGEPCAVCATPIQRFKQAGRSTFFCPTCQPPRAHPPSVDDGVSSRARPTPPEPKTRAT